MMPFRIHITDTPAKHRQHGAFSLIELLASIAVIAVLTGIVLVAFNKVRASQEKVTCASNMRQCFLAVSNYANDHNGYLPAPQQSSDGSNNWTLLIVPYYSNQPATYTGRRLAPQIQICPTNQRKIEEVTGRTYTSYFAMSLIMGPTSSQSTRARRKLESIPYPSSTLLITEAGYNSSTTIAVCDHYWLPLSATYDGVYTGGVHDGANNVLWCDGHVSSFEDIKKLIPSGPWYGGPNDEYFCKGMDPNG